MRDAWCCGDLSLCVEEGRECVERQIGLGGHDVMDLVGWCSVHFAEMRWAVQQQHEVDETPASFRSALKYFRSRDSSVAIGCT